MSDFYDELAAGISTASYIERNPEQKTRVYLIDLLEHADRHTVSLPDYVADHFKRCFDSGELSFKDATDVIDKLSEYNISKGYSWKHYTNETVYSSNTELLTAKISRLEKIDENAYDKIMSDDDLYFVTFSDDDKGIYSYYKDCQKIIGEYFYNAALTELSKKSNEPQIINDLVTLKVIDSSRELGLTLSEEQKKVIKESIEKGTMTGQEHMQLLAKISEKLTNKGLRWETSESHQPNQTIHYLDKDSKIQAYIQKLTNSNSSETVYAVNRKVFDKENKREKFITMATSNSVDSLKLKVATYYTGVATKEVAQEASKDIIKATPVKTTSKECSLSL